MHKLFNMSFNEIPKNGKTWKNIIFHPGVDPEVFGIDNIGGGDGDIAGGHVGQHVKEPVQVVEVHQGQLKATLLSQDPSQGPAMPRQWPQWWMGQIPQSSGPALQCLSPVSSRHFKPSKMEHRRSETTCFISTPMKFILLSLLAEPFNTKLVVV